MSCDIRRHVTKKVNLGRIAAGNRWASGLARPLVVRFRFHFTLPSPCRFVRHVNHKSINRYAEFRTEANVPVRCNRRNAGWASWRLRQQRAERTRIPLQRRFWIPFEDWWDHWFLWCVSSIRFEKSKVRRFLRRWQLPWVQHSPPPNPSSQTNGKSRMR
jgi:hypothetical protein